MKAAADTQRQAIAAQREAVQRQAAAAGVWLPPWSAAIGLAEPPCAPMPDPDVDPLIDGAAKAHDLEPKLIRAVIEQESGFHPCAVSATGAEGLMQLMPDTAEQLGVADPFDATQWRRPSAPTTPDRAPPIRPEAFRRFPKPAITWTLF
jgi:soluble lytic murein transglycosylase-like protein